MKLKGREVEIYFSQFGAPFWDRLEGRFGTFGASISG